jgi:hypothetical protein
MTLLNCVKNGFAKMPRYYYDERIVKWCGAIMARYTCSFLLAIHIEHLQPLLGELLQDCDLEIQYYTTDYILAREIPGNIPFSKMVKVEVLIDRSTATETETRMSMVMKNEELPLHANNHCREIFEFVKESIERCRHWHLIESLAS